MRMSLHAFLLFKYVIHLVMSSLFTTSPFKPLKMTIRVRDFLAASTTSGLAFITSSNVARFLSLILLPISRSKTASPSNKPSGNAAVKRSVTVNKSNVE